MTTRRDFLKMMAVAGAAAAVRPTGAFALPAAVEPFQVPLRVPSVMRPVRRTAEADYYRVVMRPGRAQILPGTSTPVWGFDGAFPGPTIKAQRGRAVVIRRVNRLEVPTSVHLHGGRVAPASDGFPTDLIAPGSSKRYVYPNQQDAATLWYHDHTHHHTSRNNYMGLSGLYVISDEEEAELNLPKGRYDVPVILQDRSFRRDGSFRFRDHHDEVLGDTFLVNGRPTPFFEVADRKYRFRILNASHTRGYKLQLSSGEPLVQIATDQGLLDAPSPTPAITLFPAERAEVVIDFSRHPVGTSVVLQDVDPENPLVTRPLVRFDVAREEADDSSLPASLRPVERITTWDVEREFDLSFDFDRNRWEINGKAFDPARVDVRPRRGDTELWTFRNLSSVTHPMHVHLVRMQVVSRSNFTIASNDLGWKDTVRVDPSATVQVAMRFERFTGRYAFHCHNLAHEDHSMMGQMRIVS